MALTGFYLSNNICKAKPTRVSAISFSITYNSRVYSSRISKIKLWWTHTTFKVMKIQILDTKLSSYHLHLIISDLSLTIIYTRRLIKGSYPLYLWNKWSARKEITLSLSQTKRKVPLYLITTFVQNRTAISVSHIRQLLSNVEERVKFVTRLLVAPRWRIHTQVISTQSKKVWLELNLKVDALLVTKKAESICTTITILLRAIQSSIA